MKLGLDHEKEDLGIVGAGGKNGKTTVNAWKQLLARKPNEGGKFNSRANSKLKKKMTKNRIVYLLEYRELKLETLKDMAAVLVSRYHTEDEV